MSFRDDEPDSDPPSDRKGARSARRSADDDSFDEHAAPGSTLQRVGGGMMTAFFLCLVGGRFIVRAFFAETQGMGLTPGTLAILIPVWSLGLIGLVLWVIGHRMSGTKSPVRASQEENEKGAGRH